MSARIKVILPILNQSCLIEALQRMGYKVRENGEEVMLPELSGYYKAKFQKDSSGKYVLHGDADIIPGDFTKRLKDMYFNIYHDRQARNRAEIERLRKEEAARIENRAKMEQVKKLEMSARAEVQKADFKNEIQMDAIMLAREQSQLEEEQRKKIEEEKKIAEAEKKIAEEAKRIEEELERMKEEKRRFVEVQIQTIKEKAQKMGYMVKAEKKGNSVQLVMIKREY